MIKRYYESRITYDDRPERSEVIARDEIISLVIDSETMTPETFFNHYFSLQEKRR